MFFLCSILIINVNIKINNLDVILILSDIAIIRSWFFKDNNFQ